MAVQNKIVEGVIGGRCDIPCALKSVTYNKVVLKISSSVRGKTNRRENTKKIYVCCFVVDPLPPKKTPKIN